MSGTHYHLAGAAGVGMSSLALALRHAGFDVTGSDRYFDGGDDSAVIGKLVKAGVRFVRQDGSGLSAQTAGLVVSTAIEDDNADVAAARRFGVPVIHRAAMLAKLLEGKRSVAVTGTSGKSTITGMIGWMLQQAGADPTVVNGAAILNWASDSEIGNFRGGQSDLWVFEADESDRSLMQYRPDWAVIANVSADHFDLGASRDLFRRFSGQVRQGVLSAVDRPDLVSTLTVETTAAGTVFEHEGMRYEVPLRGRHNAENALLAVMTCRLLGADPAVLRAAMSSFRGIHRRLETVGAARGVTVVDDYAHNPAKLRAAWRALVPGSRRIFGIWRPHGYGPLASMMEDLTAAFAEVCRGDDRLFILPVFDAGGTANRTVCSEMLVERLCARGVAAEAADVDRIVRAVSAAAEADDVVLTMGARDPHLPKLARRILATVASLQGGRS